MPAEIVTGLFCADYFAVFEVAGSRKGTTYTVSWDGLTAWCSCPAFKYAPEDDKGCKHIDRVFKQGCFWNEQWCDGGSLELRPVEHGSYPIVEGEECPHCGGPVCPVRIAV